jgi:pimeloyl-ACP methyl ester carboxylesterase
LELRRNEHKRTSVLEGINMNTNTMSREPFGTQSVAPPSRLLQLLEGRAMWELGATVSMWPWLALAPKGDGHPVLVLPGLVASDVSTRVLRRFLRERGYRVHGWGLGRNLGLREGVEEDMFKRLDTLHARYGEKVSVIGWSLGGLYARVLAKQRPNAVRDVITLGSPFAGSPRSTNAWRVYELASGQKSDDPSAQAKLRGKLKMPATSIYSRSDGIVAWPASIDDESDITENIEVVASHLGLGVHPAVLYAVADRLAQPEGQWKPFDRSGLRSLVYPKPGRS